MSCAPRTRLVAAALLAVGAISAQAEDAAFGPPPPGTLGLLEWPALLGADRADCGEHLLPPQPVFDQAEGGSEVGLLHGPRPTIEQADAGCSLPSVLWSDGSRNDVAIREHSYETISLLVGAFEGEAYRLQVDKRELWLRADGTARYRAIEQILPDRLTYLAPNFDGVLCPHPLVTPGCLKVAAPAAGDERAARVIGSRRVDEVLWLEVELFDAWCADAEPVALARGWTRAHDARGHWVAWFYSRGC